ncbi:pseudouridine synthase [Phellopilus nigrolimitatus]|nr:pseudouridine synthase [Phellopilus nigrolimitatus]
MLTDLTHTVSKRDAETLTEISEASSIKRTRLDSEPTNLLSSPDVAGNSEASNPEAAMEAASSSTSSAHLDVPAKLANKEKGGKKQKGGKDAKRNAGRRGTRPEKHNDENAAGGGEARGDKALRLPKRQCALLIGFCGSGYNGMQIQPNVRTIEGTLFKALVEAGAVSQDNADDPVKVGLQRAARTDAGVHAAGNVVSLKMITSVPDVPDLVSRINDELPPEIRLWSFQRVQNSFSARMSCDSRKYTYFFPSYLLIPPKPNSGLYRTFKQQSASSSSSSTTESTSDASETVHHFWEGADLSSSREEDMVRKKQWRVGADQVDALRAAAKKYEGTHNFHNFTVKRDAKDRSCFRFMKKIEVADPVVYGGTEWINVMLHGQSFMLHQRKMMCVLVMAVRTGTPLSIIDALYGPRSVSIPKMPSLGLLLEHPIFESYSKRILDLNKEKSWQPADADYRAPIDFGLHAEAMQRFKDEHIYSRMRESEEKVEVFDHWLHTFDRYAGPDMLYFNAQGVIPEAAVVKKGERRANAFKERRRFDATDFAADVPAAAFTGDELSENEEIEDEIISKKELEEAEG